MILRVNIETREAQTHAIGIIANLRSKLWTGEIPHSSGHTHRQTKNIQGWRKHAKVGGLKCLAPSINVYVLMIFTALTLKSGGALASSAPPIPPPMTLDTYSSWGNLYGVQTVGQRSAQTKESADSLAG